MERAPRKLGSGGTKRVEEREATHDISFKFSTVNTYALQDLLDLDDEAYDAELEVILDEERCSTHQGERQASPTRCAQSDQDIRPYLHHKFDI